MATSAKGIVGRSDLVKVDPREIQVAVEDNYRRDYGDIDSLAENISERGLLNPLRVRKTKEGVLELTAGYRRLRAILQAIDQGAEFVSVPCIVERKGISNVDILLTNLSTNEGLQPSALEVCEAYSRLINWGLSQADIAKKIGKSPAHVSQILKLRDASPDVITALVNKEITKGDAIAIVGESDGQVDVQKAKIEEKKKEKKKKKEKNPLEILAYLDKALFMLKEGTFTKEEKEFISKYFKDITEEFNLHIYDKWTNEDGDFN